MTKKEKEINGMQMGRKKHANGRNKSTSKQMERYTISINWKT
jgi:hypothetical protein